MNGSQGIGSGAVIYDGTARRSARMNCEETAEFSFRCPSCEEALTVNGSMRTALVERGCVVCGAELTAAAFTREAECGS